MASLNSEDFATQVSHAYIEVLRRKGLVVPASESEKIFESLREDALIMYRMKTYGFYNLGEYQNKKKAS